VCACVGGGRGCQNRGLKIQLPPQDKASEEYHNSLRRIARWVNKVIGKLDLTPSDSALALVLVATLQRRARRYGIHLLP